MEKILIIRLSAIGDIVMASPLISAFRRSGPGAHIAWLVEEGASSVLEWNEDLDEVIVWPRGRWRELLRRCRLISLAREAVSFVRDLRDRKFTLAVDAQGLLKSGIWAWLSGAPERIGLGSKEGSRLLMTRYVDRTGAQDRISSQYLVLAREIGLETGDFAMHVALSPEAKVYGEKFAVSVNVPYAVLAPFTTRPQKHWIEKRWPQLSDHLFSEFGLKTVILGGGGDSDPAARIAESALAGMIDLTGKTSLQQAAAIMENAALVVGVDTGLTHLGIALGTPTIALFGATRPYRNTAGTSGTVLYHEHECSPCRRSPTCDGLFPCMEAITVEEIVRCARELIGKDEELR